MSASNHLAVVRNPFSTAVANCKLPDGATSLSTACRYSHSKHISSANGTIFIICTPNITCPISTFEGPIGTEGATIIEHFNYSVDSRQMSLGAAGTSFSTSFPQQYRVTSQGLRLSLINNSSDNDGWFEAVRVNPSYDASDYVAVQTGTTAGTSRFHQIGQMENEMLLPLAASTPLVDWSMHPSYIAGRLRDIAKHTFMLHREDESTYIDVSEATIVAATAEGAGIPKSYTGTPWWVDTRMDTILIRLRANAVDTSTGSTQLSVHFHSVQHVEECYTPTSTFARFQTVCPLAKTALMATLGAMRRDMKPSMLRVATAPVTTRKRSGARTRRYYRRRTKR